MLTLGSVEVRASLAATLISPSGRRRSLGVLARDRRSLRQLWSELRRAGKIPLFMTFAAFALVVEAEPTVLLGLVTTAGVNYMAADFLSGSSSRINAFNQHDCGTGTTAAAVGDTALQTPTGGARVAGTQSNPSANVYRSVATISFTSTLAITEWGLFSAASAGTLWDRRVFAAINVVNGDSIQFTYDLTIPSGGS